MIVGTRAIMEVVTESAAELVDVASGLSEPVDGIRVRDIPIGTGLDGERSRDQTTEGGS